MRCTQWQTVAIMRNHLDGLRLPHIPQTRHRRHREVINEFLLWGSGRSELVCSSSVPIRAFAPISANQCQSSPWRAGVRDPSPHQTYECPCPPACDPPRISSVTISDHQRSSEAIRAINGDHHTCSRIQPPICDATLSIASLGLSPSIATFQPTRVKNSPPDKASSLRWVNIMVRAAAAASASLSMAAKAAANNHARDCLGRGAPIHEMCRCRRDRPARRGRKFLGTYDECRKIR